MKAQDQEVKEDHQYFYWQSDHFINYGHFQSESDEDCQKFNEMYGLKMSANIDLKSVVDIPKSHQSKKAKKRTGDDIAYLAPIFCKECSCKLTEDSTELVVYQLLFDVAEMCARGAKKELAELKDQMQINNVNTMFFNTVKSRWDEHMRESWGHILMEVLVEKKDGAYEEWRTKVNDRLERDKVFATKQEEIDRLISGQPIKTDYIEAKMIMGALKKESH